jgi:hypothetical protein
MAPIKFGLFGSLAKFKKLKNEDEVTEGVEKTT